MNEFWNWFDDYAEKKLRFRAKTFRMIFEHLDKFNNPIIIETGCVGEPDDETWAGHGCSTLLFDKYISLNGGSLWSVDINFDKVQAARKLVGDNSQIAYCDSVEFLKDFSKSDNPSPHLVYLDSYDFDRYVATESQVHHHNELRAIFPKLTPDTLVVVDDSPVGLDENEDYTIGGKGALVSKYASELGVPIAFAGYQSGWIGFPGFRNNDDRSIAKLLERAKELTDKDKWSEAYALYSNIYLRIGIYKKSFDNIKSFNTSKIDKMQAEVCVYFGRMASSANRYGTSYDWFRKALDLDPNNTEYRLEMITKAMRPLGWMTVARQEAIYATEKDPDNPIAWCVLGQIEAEFDNVPASLEAYSKFVDKSNNSSFSLLTKATFLVKTEQYKEADTLCDVIIARNESLGDTYACKAIILANYDNHEGAIELFEKAILHGSHDPSMARYFLSLSLFSIGRHEEGWRQLFAARLENTSFPPLYGSIRRFHKDKKNLFVWQPAPAVIHIHAEAGEGDNLQLMRYIPLLAEKGYKVRYETKSGIVKLAQDSFPNVEVIPLAKDFPGTSDLPDFDYHLPIVDLPFIFQTGIENIPTNVPYLKADPKLVETYKAYKGKIGICWSTRVLNWDSGSKNQSYAQNKSLRFDWLRPIIDINPSMFVSLQAGPARAENDRIASPLNGKDFIWAETAALVENLDLVISIDTSVAHLAGAMGKPTWLMMHKYLTSFQFLAEYKDAFWNTESPWYPSMRIFRQKTRGDWNSVTTRMAHELRKRYQIMEIEHVGSN